MTKEKLFTCFGIERKKNIVAFSDPIKLEKENLDSFKLPESLEKKIELIHERGILFIESKNIQKITNQIELLAPNILTKKESIFFNDKEKRILFKIKNYPREPTKIKSRFRQIINKIKLSNKTELDKTIKKEFPQRNKERWAWQHKWKLSLKKAKQIVIYADYSLFILINPTEYRKMKETIKENFKDTRIKPKK